MLHHLFVRYYLTIGDTLFCFQNTQVGLLGSHRSIVHYFQFLFFKKIYVSHLYGLFIAAKIVLFLLTTKFSFIFLPFLY